jgi:recombinational DNA repair protein (RecF pathway)
LKYFPAISGAWPCWPAAPAAPRAAIRGLLMAFSRWKSAGPGKGEVLTLMKAEWQGGQPLLAGEALFCGYYLNELLMHLLPREDAHERLFAAMPKCWAPGCRSIRQGPRGRSAQL